MVTRPVHEKSSWDRGDEHHTQACTLYLIFQLGPSSYKVQATASAIPNLWEPLNQTTALISYTSRVYALPAPAWDVKLTHGPFCTGHGS
jgi:hypothetical protein